MNSKNDAYGQEVWAFLKGNKCSEIIERDDGFIDISSGPKTYFSTIEDWPAIEKKAIRLARGNVLDIGTGAGRIALYLQQKGLAVTAIDNSPLAVKVCRERGVKIAIIRPIEDIAKFKPKTFDTVIMFGNNFGLFSNFKKTRTLLKKMHEITKPDALILAESNDPYNTKDKAHSSYHQSNKDRGRMGGQVRIRVRFRDCVGEWFDYLLVSKKEMEQILEGTGWRVRNFIDSDKGLFIAVIEKEKSSR